MKKFLVILIVLLTITVMVFANGQAETSKKKTIDVWYGMTGPDGAYINDIIEAFEAANPDINVVGNAYEWATLWVKLEAAYAAGDPPEAVIMHVQDVPQFVEKGMLSAVPAFDANLYLDNTLEGGNYKGKQYALPIDLHTATMYYNVDMFKAVGLDPDNPPKTYDELIAAAEKLTIPNKGQWGFGLETRVDGGYYAFLGAYWQNGGELLTADYTKSLVNCDAMRKTLKQYKDLAWKYKVSPRNLEDSVREFRAQKIAIVFGGTWQNAPIGGLPEVEGLNYRTAKLPLFGDTEAYWKSGHVVTTINNPDKDKQALGALFTKFASENSLYWNKSGMIPVTKAASVDPSLAELSIANKGCIDQMPYARFVPLVPYGASELFDGSLDRPIMKMLQTYYTDENASVDSVISECENTMNNVLSRYYK